VVVGGWQQQWNKKKYNEAREEKRALNKQLRFGWRCCE